MSCWDKWEIQDEHKMEFHVQESVAVALSHLQLCNGQVRFASIYFQLERYIGTMLK